MSESKVKIFHDSFVEYCLEEITRQQRIEAGLNVPQISSSLENSLSSASRVPILGTAANALLVVDKFHRSIYENERRINEVFGIFPTIQVKRILSSAILSIANSLTELKNESCTMQRARELAASAKTKLFEFIKRKEIHEAVISAETIVKIIQQQNNWLSNDIFVQEGHESQEHVQKRARIEGASELDDFDSDIFQIERIQARMDNIEQQACLLYQTQQLSSQQAVRTECFYNAPEVVHFFIGRASLLNQMYQYSLTHMNAVQGIGGIGGIGKTQTILQYISLHGHEYNHRVRYFLASSQDSLENAFREFATAIDIPTNKRTNEEIIKAVKSALENRIEHSLLFFDSAINYDFIKDYLPNKGARNKHHIFITTQDIKAMQDGAIYTGARIIILEPLIREDSIAYITTSLTRANPTSEEANTLAELFCDFPLGLSQSVSFINSHNLKIKTYLAEYEKAKNNEQLLVRLHDSNCDPHMNNIYITLSMTLARLAKQNPKALELLRYFSYLNAENIPEFLINNLFDNLIEQNEIISVLEGYSLISVKKEIIYMHRLIQDIVRITITEKASEIIKIAMKLIHKHMKSDIEVIESLRRSQLLLPHAISLIDHCNNLATSSDSLTKKTADLYSDCANVHSILLKQNKALEMNEQALQRYISVYGRNHKKTAAVISNIGAVLQAAKDPQQAITKYEEALAIYETLDNYDYLNIAIVIRKIANCYLDLKETDQALAQYRKALEIYKNNSDPLNIASTIEEIGNVYKVLMMYRQALEQYNDALTLSISIHGQKSQKVAEIIQTMGNIYRNLKDYAQAEEQYRTAIAITTEIHGEKHLSIAINLCGICKIYYALAKYNEALELYERILIILRQAFGENHLMIGSVMHDIGNIYEEQKQYEQALEFYNKAFFIYQETYAERNSDIARVINSIKKANKKLFAEKETLQQSPEINVSRQCSEESSQNVITTILNLAKWTQYIDPSQSLASQSLFSQSPPEREYSDQSSQHSAPHQSPCKATTLDSQSSSLGNRQINSNILLFIEENLKECRGKILLDLIVLYQDQEVAEIIEDATEEYGVAHVVETIFGYKISSPEEIKQDMLDKISRFFGINDIHSTVNVLSNNNPVITRIAKFISFLIEEFENWADTRDSYLVIDNYAQAIIKQLPYLFSFIASGQPHRAPFSAFNPDLDGDYGDGGNGGTRGNSSTPEQNNDIILSLLAGGNSNLTLDS